MVAGETVFRPPPLISGRGDVISAPFPWNFTGEDNLRVVLFNSVVGVVARLQGRFLEKAALQPGAFDRTFTPSADRLATTFDLSMGEGALLDCSVDVVSGTPLVGQTFAMVKIIRGLGGATMVLGTLLAGYITAQQSIGYPGSPIQASTDGVPPVRRLIGTDPAPGVEIVETAPVGARWEVISVRAILTTDATPVLRRPILRYRVAPLSHTVLPAPDTIGASINANFLWTQGVPWQSVPADHFYNGPLPLNAALLAGDVITTFTLNLQAGDNYDAPILAVREWLEVA